jgi:hypothetical protein
MKTIASLLALAALAACATAPDGTSEAERSGGGAASGDVLPNAALSAFVAGVETVSSRGDDELVRLEVSTVSSDSVFRPAIEKAREEGEAGVDLPLQTANELVVLLRPDLSPQEAQGALAEISVIRDDCAVSKTMPEIGAIVISCEDLKANSDGVSLAETRAAAINQLAERLRSNSRFAAVSANTVMSSTSIVSAVLPEIERSVEAGEVIDWGIAASKVDQVWPLLTRNVAVGVIDVGFASHADLPLAQGLPDRWFANDHGNHVAGIMCARHNGVGVKGVLPNCQAFAASGEFLLQGVSPIEGDDAIAFQARFSEYIATVLSFMEANPDVKVINLSLGYNWMPNFGEDPRDADNAALRDLVRGQGRFFQSILAYAKRRNIAIFSAAGNDSTDLATPLEAEWASPFNFGAKLMKEADGWSNGVVVEAYDEMLRRASFSNSKGDITCPGVDVKSALARPANGYGVMSGTSMASPYCAAGFAALRSLQPTVPLKRALECYLGVSGRVAGAPRMDLKAAFEACRDGA